MYLSFFLFLYFNTNFNIFSTNKRLSCCGSTNSKNELLDECDIKKEVNDKFICEKSKIVEEEKTKYFLSDNKEIVLDNKYKDLILKFKENLQNNNEINTNFEDDKKNKIFNEIKDIFKNNNENIKEDVLKNITEVLCNDN